MDGCHAVTLAIRQQASATLSNRIGRLDMAINLPRKLGNIPAVNIARPKVPSRRAERPGI